MEVYNQGSEIENDHVDGDEIAIERSPASVVVASGRGSRGEMVLGTGMTGARLRLRRFKDTYFRVTVVNDLGREAWPNGVWLD